MASCHHGSNKQSNKEHKYAEIYFTFLLYSPGIRVDLFFIYLFGRLMFLSVRVLAFRHYWCYFDLGLL